jgi:hypothetical protein
VTVTWDERLISRARAADLCGTWTIKSDPPFLRCGICSGSILRLPDPGFTFTGDTFISAVTGHMVKCHNYSLSGGPQNGDQPGAG